MNIGIIYSLVKSIFFRTKFNKANLLKIILKHCGKFKKPKVVWWNFAIHFQHITIQHHYISDWNFIFTGEVSKVLGSVFRQLTNKHNTHASWITCDGNLTLSVIYLIILIQLIKLQILSFIFPYSLDITIDHTLTVFYQFVFQYKMYKSMAKLNIC